MVKTDGGPKNLLVDGELQADEDRRIEPLLLLLSLDERLKTASRVGTPLSLVIRDLDAILCVSVCVYVFCFMLARQIFPGNQMSRRPIVYNFLTRMASESSCLRV